MRKALRLPLLSLILLISLTTICLAEEKTGLHIFDLYFYRDNGQETAIQSDRR